MRGVTMIGRRLQATRSTPSIREPTMPRIPRRIVSTSGSSGTRFNHYDTKDTETIKIHLLNRIVRFFRLIHDCANQVLRESTSCLCAFVVKLRLDCTMQSVENQTKEHFTS